MQCGARAVIQHERQDFSNVDAVELQKVSSVIRDMIKKNKTRNLPFLSPFVHSFGVLRAHNFMYW